MERQSKSTRFCLICNYISRYCYSLALFNFLSTSPLSCAFSSFPVISLSPSCVFEPSVKICKLAYTCLLIKIISILHTFVLYMSPESVCQLLQDYRASHVSMLKVSVQTSGSGYPERATAAHCTTGEYVMFWRGIVPLQPLLLLYLEIIVNPFVSGYWQNCRDIWRRSAKGIPWF